MNDTALSPWKKTYIQEIVRRFAGKGLAGFIQKPYQIKTIVGELKKVLEGN